MLHAQHPVVARDDSAYMEQLAEGVYAIIHDDATTDWATGTMEWPHGNTGVVVGPDGVLVVDATYLPARARADIALIRSITTQPVRYLVNTHWHGDHTHGNGVYVEEFPGVVIIGQEMNREWIATNLARYPGLVGRGLGGKQATLDGLRALLTAGRDSTGRALTEAQKQTLAENIERRQHELDEFRRIRVVPPSVLLHDRMTLYLGERRVELHNRGRANSPADVTVYLPQERVLFAGDIIVMPAPFVGASHPLPWIGALRTLQALPVSSIVPGHGPVQQDHTYTSALIDLFETAVERTRSAQRRGMLQEETIGSIDLSDVRARWPSRDHPHFAYHWDRAFEEVLLERVYQCVQGYRC